MIRKKVLLLLFIFILALTTASVANVSAYSGSESGYHVKLVTPPEFADTSSEDAYRMTFIVNPETSGFLRTEGNYKLGLNLYTSGVGGGYSEEGFKLYLVPEQAFISYSCDITANDPICIERRPIAAAEVPAITPIGMLALIGILSVVLAVATMRKRRK